MSQHLYTWKSAMCLWPVYNIFMAHLWENMSVLFDVFSTSLGYIVFM